MTGITDTTPTSKFVVTSSATRTLAEIGIHGEICIDPDITLEECKFALNEALKAFAAQQQEAIDLKSALTVSPDNTAIFGDIPTTRLDIKNT